MTSLSGTPRVARSLCQRIGAEAARIFHSLRCARVLIVLAIVATSTSKVSSQQVDRQPHPLLGPLKAQEKPLIADVQEQWFLPLAEQLKLEVELIAKVGGLDDEQTKLLLVRGAKAIERPGGLLLQAGGNQRALQRLQVLNGRLRMQNVPVEPSSRAIRRSLTPLLQEISPDAAARFRTERDRLEVYRQRASAMAQIAVFDECLSLSSEQRARFGEMLTDVPSDAWWRPTDPGPMLRTPAHRLFTVLAEGGLGGFIIPEVDLAKLLGLSQFAAFKELRQLHEFVLDPKGARPRAAVAAFAQPAPTPVLDSRTLRLTRCLEQWVENIDAACKLSGSQREKLMLAGKLDIQHLRELVTPPENPPDREIVVETIRIGSEHLQSMVFREDRSYFQKALQRVLLDEQKQRLVESERQRREFQRKSLVDVVVIGFESCAALTAEQCEEISRSLNAALADADLVETPDWLLDCVRHVAELPERELRPILFDFQVDAVRRHNQHLAAAAQQFAASERGATIKIMRDREGKVRQIEILYEGAQE